MKVSLKKIKHETIDGIINWLKQIYSLEPPISNLVMMKPHKKGIDRELDKLHRIVNGTDWYLNWSNKTEKTGIQFLKFDLIKCRILYWSKQIKLSLSRLRPTVVRKRFITKETKEHEEIILTAEEKKINDIEYADFSTNTFSTLEHVSSQETASPICTPGSSC